MTNTERIADAGETMELGVVVSALRRKYELEKRGRCSKCTATNDMCNICHIGAVKAAAALILSLTERIKELESELTRLHNMLSAVSNPQENIATYSDFIKASLEDGAKKLTDIDEQYTGSRPYCD